ncbi:GNAT family N-acetyltransferase [soil metagenome]
MVAEFVREERAHLRTLGAVDLPELSELVGEDSLVNLFVDYRLRSTRLDSRWFGGEMWGYFEDGVLVSACHAAANLVPIQATPDALDMFAQRAMTMRRQCSSIVGRRGDVMHLWSLLEPTWGPARSPRLNQPFMVLAQDSVIAPDPRVRATLMDEFDLLYPSCVAMFTEEVGMNPEGHNREGYRARVAQLISQGWSFVVVEDDQVVFKAEVGAATPFGCQIQGVYVAPQWRGQGLAAPAMAGVVKLVRETIAPVVTLYVNDHNVAAKRAYESAGFRQTETFATILL